MNCIENAPHDKNFKWSANEYDALSYDIGNLNCSVKIRVKWVLK